MSFGWPAMLAYAIWMRSLISSLSHPDDLPIVSISSRWLNSWWYLIRMTKLLAVSHPDDSWTLHYVIRMTYPADICHPGDFGIFIRMSYDNAIMSSGWHALPFLSHLDEIANFDVAPQCFRYIKGCCSVGYIHPSPPPRQNGAAIYRWRHLQMHINEWKILYFDSTFTEVCSQGSN